MNFWKPIILFVFMITGLLNFKVEAREPAVEPVMGLSIEEYETVPPEKSQGFDFEQSKTSPESGQRPEINQVQAPVSPRSLMNQSAPDSTESPATFFYVLLSLLPFVVWFGLMKNLDENTDEGHTAQMYDLEEQRRKKQQSHDNDDLPKAS